MSQPIPRQGMSYTDKTASIKPRIIIHGGAGRITRENLPAKPYAIYRRALLDTLRDANHRLQLPGATALDVATHAVTLLENNGLFNSGHGAVYTTEGTHELEASVMVSRGYRKRGVGVMGVKKAKNPIALAREMLIRGQEDDGGGAQGHVQLHGETCDRLAVEWGLELARPSHFWTKRRWDEHRKALGLKHDRETYEKDRARADEDAGYGAQVVEVSSSPDDVAAARLDNTSWDGKEYLPQGTVGAVVMDDSGTICVATSTGGITNKLPGRIGDTPTLGAGFWAEEWTETKRSSGIEHSLAGLQVPSVSDIFTSSCMPWLGGYGRVLSHECSESTTTGRQSSAVAMSGTGNGDSFLRLAATRTAAAMARFASARTSQAGGSSLSLQAAVSQVAGPNGMLQQSAEDRWLKSGEGEGGMIAIELNAGKGHIVFDFNCGGMFHVWIDDEGRHKFQVFRDQTDVE